MATTYRTPNPLIQRIQNDGVFGAGLPQPENQLSTESKLNMAQQGTFNAFRSGLGPQTDFGAINTAANQPTFDASMFGGVPSLANLGLHPSGGPTTSYAPTGLRQQAIAAGGAPVTGFGGTQITAAPNAQGGTAFSLTQAGMPQGAQGMIDPNPTPAAMQFLQDGVAPTNPGPFPRLGVPAAQTVQQVPPQPPVSNAIFSQNQQPLPGGLGNYLPKGNPEQIKAQLGVIKPLQEMHQKQVEDAATFAAHQPGVKDRLSTYMNAGGRNAQMINALRKEQADSESKLGKASIAQAYQPIDMAEISKNPSGFDDNSGRVYDSLAHAQVDKLTKQMQAMAAVDNPDPKALSTLQDKMFKAQDAAEAQDVLASNKASALRTIDSILPQIKSSNMGYASYLAHLPATEQRDFKANVEQLKAIFSVEGLKTLKNVRNEREFDAIARAVANPDTLQSPENFKRVMNNAREVLIGEVGKDTYGKLQQHWGTGGTPAAPTQGKDLGDGWVMK